MVQHENDYAMIRDLTKQEFIQLIAVKLNYLNEPKERLIRKLIPKKEFMQFVGLKYTQIGKLERKYGFQKISIGKSVFYTTSSILRLFESCTD